MDKVISKSKGEVASFSLAQTLRDFIIQPVKAGLIGFVTFISILISIKYISSLLNVNENFFVDLDDIYVSFVGFVLMFLVRFIENFKPKDTENSLQK